MLTDARLRQIADALVRVQGVTGVMLGGSRARGAETLDSDVDLGLYYRPPLDVDALQALADASAEPRSGAARPRLTKPGEWGPWVDGGAWLTVDGVAVDWIYRDLDRVHRSWELAQEGAYSFHFQVGHPLGVPDFAYAGEVALGVVLADPAGELTRLHEQAVVYPPKLARAVVSRLNEAEFLLGSMQKPAKRGDAAFLAGCLFRVIGLCAHALHSKAGRWAINEKGLVDAAGRLSGSPLDFTARAHAVVGSLGTGPAALQAAVRTAEVLVADVTAS